MNASFFEQASVARLAAMLASGEMTSREMVTACIDRIHGIDQTGPTLRSVLEVNPDAESLAEALDRERRETGARGPLHGIPVLIKDNLDTRDRMPTTAGSLALLDTVPSEDATVVRKLREAGAILLGKANLSEWANFRSSHSSSGWSARGGQCLNPYALDRTPSGSSSGSAAAVAAGLAPLAVGTETDGSILSPASACGVVGIKSTVGLTSRAGVIPISHSQDTVGSFGKTVADAAVLLSAICGADDRDPMTQGAGAHAHDYSGSLLADGLRGARIGVAREVYFGDSPKAARVAEDAIQILREMGAEIIDPADIPTAKEIETGEGEAEVLLYEFKAGLNAYLAARGPNSEVHTLADLIEFNSRHSGEELQYFGQELFERAEEKGPLSDPSYIAALETNHRLARDEGIDAVMTEYSLDALVMPTGGPAIKIDLVNGGRGYGGSSQPAALAGYPAISVPAGYVAGLPVGITFMGCAWSEPTLIRLAFAFEQASKVWRPPRYSPSS